MALPYKDAPDLPLDPLLSLSLSLSLPCTPGPTHSPPCAVHRPQWPENRRRPQAKFGLSRASLLSLSTPVTSYDHLEALKRRRSSPGTPPARGQRWPTASSAVVQAVASTALVGVRKAPRWMPRGLL